MSNIKQYMPIKKKQNMFIFLLLTLTICLAGCDTQNTSSSQEKKSLQPAVKLSPDATTHAQQAWIFINQVEPLLEQKQLDVLETQVRQPINQLRIDWQTQVKMTDAVTEGKYALCRKTLNSMDIWARELLQNGTQVDKKREDYLRDKALCQNAIENPELGNTDPKRMINPTS